MKLNTIYCIIDLTCVAIPFDNKDNNHSFLKLDVKVVVKNVLICQEKMSP